MLLDIDYYFFKEPIEKIWGHLGSLFVNYKEIYKLLNSYLKSN